MIMEVAQALQEEYDTGTALKALNTGGAYFQLAPPNVDSPYIVYNWDGSAVEEFAGSPQGAAQTARNETVNIAFTCYSKNDDGGVEVGQISDALMDLFDWATLTYSTLTHIACQRAGTTGIVFFDEVWQVGIIYEITFGH